ncbi:MAG: hypothetical protein M3525_08335 [Acidobacteriota bacterium]|nr:hypothetical protein [Acidobacteriota bacterium]
MGKGDFGDYGYIGLLNFDGRDVFDNYILAWHRLEQAVLARRMRIGDGTRNSENYSEIISGTAAPTVGSYRQGYIVLNRNYTTGGVFCWVNRTGGAADFEAISIGGTTSSGSALDVNGRINSPNGLNYLQITDGGVQMRTQGFNATVIGGGNGDGLIFENNGQLNYPTTNNLAVFGKDLNRFANFYTNFVNLKSFTPTGSADASHFLIFMY